MAASRTLELIQRLVSFDTTSRQPNLKLIAYLKDYLNDLGVESQLVHNAENTKANLYATIGDKSTSGIMLSGHTDVVPVDGQTWDADPFQVRQADGRLYGRGTADMKSFIAIALSLLPEFIERGLATPLHLAFSYDEEIGCIGVRRLIDKLKGMPVKPMMCIVGEPTNLQVVTGHKGKRSYVAEVRGFEAHSSLAPQGVNAIEYAAELIAYIKKMAHRIAASGPYDKLYDVTHTTLQTGVIGGGTQLNIVPRICQFEFEFRYIGDNDPDALETEIREFSASLTAEMQSVQADAGIEITMINDMPGLDMDVDSEVVTFVKSLAERNDHAKVAFGTEAGLFHQRAGIPAVVCGPGSINQAHKPNEYIELSQVEAGEAFMKRLMDKICIT